ncbi:MAG: DUF559 domain-containing protein [Pseudomonadota bacterium]
MHANSHWKPRRGLRRAQKSRLHTACTRLWMHVGHGKLGGLVFARNYPVMLDEGTGFVVDIVHLEAAVIIEVDDGLPANRHDARVLADRDSACMEAGWRIIRLWRQEVEDNLEGCLMQIRYAVEARLMDR